MSIHKKSDGVFEVRWREGGRNKSLRVHGAYELARKIERKKMSVRDENRHLDIKREINFRMSALIDRYWTHYGVKKRSSEQGEKRSGRHSIRIGPLFRSGNRRRRNRALVRKSDGETRSVAGDGRSALQRHAPHDGEGVDDLVEGNRD